MSTPRDEAFSGTERFSVVRLLGAGGMGTVYEVHDRERGQRVALKAMRGRDPAALYLFKQEFRSLASLSHPNLLPLYELFEDRGTWCFTMELLEGALDFRRWVWNQAGGGAAHEPTAVTEGRPGVLAADAVPLAAPPSPPEPLARGAMPADEARLRAALAQLVEGVTALHAAGMLHRDLKPENVLVTPDGRLRLLDFGLVAELHVDTRAAPDAPAGSPSGSPGRLRRVHESADSHLAGTIHYMSPEQATALPLSPASDWYAVGVMLYEALTGQKPFGGRRRTLHELVDAMGGRAPAAPSSIVSGVPADLNDLCLALLDRDPERRPGGAALRAVVSGTAAPAPRTDEEGWETEPPFVGREPHLATLARAFEHARSGAVVICRVHGRSGAGKSALLDHFQRQLAARTSVVTLSGRCYEQESVPYKAWDSLVDSLYRHLARLPPAELDALLPEDVADLARAFPVLRRLPAVASAGDAPGGGAEPREQRRSAFRALGRLLGRLAATRPVVLTVDDLQWGDVDSVELLADLVETPELGRVLLLLAYRSEYEHTSACLAALAAAERTFAPRVAREAVEVAAMSEGETLQLALTLLGPARAGARELAERILRESSGNAFFVHELARHARAGMDLAAAGAGLDSVIAARVALLEPGPRRLLEAVAVAGQPIRARDAAAACGFESLPPAFVTQLRTSHFARTSGPGLDDAIECFHDRVRESVASRLEPGTRLAWHERLARVLEASGRAEPQTVAAHLQFSAPGEASRYFAKAGAAAASVLAFERAEQYFREAVRLAGSAPEKAAVQEALIHFYTDMARFTDAYALGREATAAFGVKLPAGFNPPALLADLALARLHMGRRSVGSLADLPEMTDERCRWAVRLISACAKAAFQVRPELCVAISAKAVRLCLRHGNTAESPVPYMVFGAIFLGGVLGRYQTGYDFGRLSLGLVERFGNRKQRAEVHFVVGYFGTSWLRPATEAEALWRTARDAGRETGDLFHTGCACAGIAQSQLMRGVRLDAVLEEAESHLEWLERAQQREPAGCLHAVRQTVRSLRGETASRTSFDSPGFREDAFVSGLERYGSRHFAHYYFVDKMQALYLWKEYEQAHELAVRAAGYLKDSKGMLHGAEHVFYDGLIHAALAGEAGSRPALGRAVRRARRRFGMWAALCPANFGHKHRLLEAEASRLRGATTEARAHYDAAVALAHEHGYLQVAGIANERAASLVERQPDGTADAVRYREAARRAFSDWGASALAEAVRD